MNTEETVLKHMPLIENVVRHIGGRLPSHIDRDDLRSEGVFGLMDAIEKFDPNRGAAFKTYAQIRIKGAILDHLRALDWVPRPTREKYRQLEAARAEVEQTMGESATEIEIADSMGIEMDEFYEMKTRSRGAMTVNLDSGMGTEDGSGTFGDIIADTGALNGFDALKVAEAKQTIADAIGFLKERARQVMSLYYYEDRNMKEIGGILGISESRVCQIHTESVERLKFRLKEAA